MELIRNTRAHRDREEGFTLIELMVVVLIIAILIAIAIPTFLGARSRAQDKAAQSNDRNGVTAAKTIFTDSNAYLQDANGDPTGAPANLAALNTELAGVEPSLNYLANNVASTQPKDLSIGTVDNDANVVGVDEVVLVSKSKSGKCWAVSDIQSATAPAGRVVGTSYAEITAGACSADVAIALAAATWSDSF